MSLRAVLSNPSESGRSPRWKPRHDLYWPRITSGAFRFLEKPTSVEARPDILEGQPWFVATGVLQALNITQGGDTYERLASHEKKVVSGSLVPHRQGSTLSKRGKRYMVIDESGVYRMVMRSDRPEAVEFPEWLANDVIPIIARTGGYIMGEEKVFDPADMDKLILDCAARRR